MCSAWKRLGVKSFFGKSQPGRTLQRDLTYTLSLCGIWAQCIVFQEYVFFVEAWSLVGNAPTWNKQSSELFTQSLAELVRVLGQGVMPSSAWVFASNHSNVISTLEVRKHPIL